MSVYEIPGDTAGPLAPKNPLGFEIGGCDQMDMLSFFVSKNSDIGDFVRITSISTKICIRSF